MNRCTSNIYPFVLALVLLVPGTSRAQETSAALFDQGTQALQQGNFQDAISAYEKSREQGHVSAELLHNTGVAWYRLGDTGRAILFLERARLLQPGNERIYHSLLIAQRLKQDTFSALPAPFWQRAHRWILGQLSAGLLFGIGATLLFLWGGATGFRLFMLRTIRHGDRLERWSLTLAVPFLAFALFSSARPPWPERAIVLANSVDLTEQAAPESALVERLHSGTEVHLQAQGDGWVFVRLTNGVEGWLPMGSIESV